MAHSCPHIAQIVVIRVAETPVCALCVETHSQWVHLRTCQECGVTLCCDSSPNRHASNHARQSGHPVISSAEPGERWVYCFADDVYGEY